MSVAQARMTRAQAQARYVSGGDEPQVQLTGQVERQRYSAVGLFPRPCLAIRLLWVPCKWRVLGSWICLVDNVPNWMRL